MDEFKRQVALRLSEKLNLALSDVENLIEMPPEGLGDYAFPCFSLAKAQRKAPQQIAVELAVMLSSSLFEKVEPKGAYVNFFLNREQACKAILQAVFQSRQCYGSKPVSGQSVMIESPGPNTNKPLHLGHVRNMVLGSSLCLINEALGNKVMKVDIINDRGVHICKSMLAYQMYGHNCQPDKKSDHFVGDFYVLYSKSESEHPELADKIHELLLKWEQGDAETIALWKLMNSWAVDGMRQTYKRYGVRIDKPYFESEHYLKGRDVVLEGLKNGLFVKDEQGNTIVDLESSGLGKKVVLRSDGTSIYITQDLALAGIRYNDYHMDRMIYIVGSEQILHFQVLFKLFEMLGYPFAKNCFHLAYGMVYLPEGKMKSREGTVVDADNLAEEMHQMALKEIKERHGELDDLEADSRAEKIAMAAIKFFVLKYDPLKDFVYDPKESMSFEGETGPYVQYTYARIASILRKHGQLPSPEVDCSKLAAPGEYALIKMLNQYPEIVEKAGRDFKPNAISRYLLDTSQVFNEFYHNSPVLNAEPAVRDARLALIYCIKQVLSNGLALLGIETLEEM